MVLESWTRLSYLQFNKKTSCYHKIGVVKITKHVYLVYSLQCVAYWPWQSSLISSVFNSKQRFTGNMSPKLFTVADVKYIDGSTLRTWILQGHTNLGSKFQIVDVRDEDHVGGHIIHSIHIPSTKFNDNLSTLLQRLEEQKKDTVIFHCMLSQQRGPSSAMRFMRYLNEKLEMSEDEQECEFIENMNICILRGGFGKWQSSYGDDPRLTDSYQKDIWKYGY